MVLSFLANKIAPESGLAETIFPPPTKFNVEDIPDLAGKTIIVTGANAGIGYQTARALLLHNAKVYVACRSKDKADKAIAQLKEETGKDAHFLSLDFGDLRKVKESANDFLSREKRLDVLFNNAGVMVPPPDQVTAQNLDLQFGTNTLAPYYFTKLLLPALKASKEATGVPARVVNTSSSAHKTIPPEAINFNTLVKGDKRDAIVKQWGGLLGKWRLYGQSKIGNIFVSHILNDNYGDVLVSASVHPGGIRSDLQRHMGWQAALINPLLHPVKMGALTQLYAGTKATEDEMRGKYFIPWARIGKPDPRSDDTKLRQQVKDWMEQQIAAL